MSAKEFMIPQTTIYECHGIHHYTSQLPRFNSFRKLVTYLGKAAALEVESKIVEGSPAWSLA